MGKLASESTANICGEERAQAVMERALLEAYLKSKGHSLKSLKEMPREKADALMAEACLYSSLRLAQMESAAHFREKINRPS